MLGKLLCAVKHGETLVNVFTQAIQSGPRHRIALMHRRVVLSAAPGESGSESHVGTDRHLSERRLEET